jgi:hypothetical protein
MFMVRTAVSCVSATPTSVAFHKTRLNFSEYPDTPATRSKPKSGASRLTEPAQE